MNSRIVKGDQFYPKLLAYTSLKDNTSFSIDHGHHSESLEAYCYEGGCDRKFPALKLSRV
jgi:hypothetical protein